MLKVIQTWDSRGSLLGTVCPSSRVTLDGVLE